MKETELTVEVFEKENSIETKLKNIGFKIIEEYTIDDIYMSNKHDCLKNLSNYDILKNTLLLRNINKEKKEIVYKKKEFNEKGEVLFEEKYKIPIEDTVSAEKFFECIGFKKIFEMYNYTKLYEKDGIELNVQKMKNLGIFIELEMNTLEKDLVKTREKMKGILKSLPIKIGKDFDVKKAHLMLDKVRKATPLK